VAPHLIIQDMPEQHTAKVRNQELQKIAMLGTAHIIQKVLIKIKNKKEKTCTPIDMSIPADRNLEQKKSEKKIVTRD